MNKYIYKTFLRFFLLIALTSFISLLNAANVEVDNKNVRIARWKDDKTAVFLLMFDDSWPSHWQVAVPELEKRGMIATFYINPGKGEYQKFANEWEDNLWRHGMVYGDHTMTHKGVKNMQDAEIEIGECARIIRKITGNKEDSLVSYGQPGVDSKDWNITQDQTNQLLKKYHLIDRPTFTDHGAVYHLKSADQMLDLADKAIKNKGMEYLIIHGVERIKENWGYQDFWALKQDVFLPLLDGLASRRDNGELWITDHISQHKYETERNSAQVKVLSTDEKKITLSLTARADVKQYDFPLTILLRVPANWKKAIFIQGNNSENLNINNQEVRFNAKPNDEKIFIKAIN